MDNILCSSQLINWTFNGHSLHQKRKEVFRSAVRRSVSSRVDYEKCDLYSYGTRNYNVDNFQEIFSDSGTDPSFNVNDGSDDTKNRKVLTPFTEASKYMDSFNLNTPENQKTRGIHYNMYYSSPLRRTNYNFIDVINNEEMINNRVNQLIDHEYINIDEQQCILYYYSTKIVNICLKCIKFLEDFLVDNPSHDRENVNPNILEDFNHIEVLKTNFKQHDMLIKYHYFIAKSIIYFRRFFLKVSVIEFDITYAIYGSILLASKAENLLLSPIELIRNIENEISAKLTSMTKLSGLSEKLLSSIELKILKSISYNLVVYLPFDCVIKYLKIIEVSEKMKNIIKLNTVELCQKIILTDHIFLYHPNDLALCILNKVINENNFNSIQTLDMPYLIQLYNSNIIDFPSYPLINSEFLEYLHGKYSKSLSIFVDVNYINYRKNKKSYESNHLQSSCKRKFLDKNMLLGENYKVECNDDHQFKRANLFSDSDSDEYRLYSPNKIYDFSPPIPTRN